MKEIDASQKIVDKGRAGLIVDRLGRSDLLQYTVIKNGDAIGDFKRLFLVVRDQDGGDM